MPGTRCERRVSGIVISKKDIPEEHLGLTIHRLKKAEEAFAILFADDKWKEKGESHDGRTHSTAEH